MSDVRPTAMKATRASVTTTATLRRFVRQTGYVTTVASVIPAWTKHNVLRPPQHVATTNVRPTASKTTPVSATTTAMPRCTALRTTDVTTETLVTLAKPADNVSRPHRFAAMTDVRRTGMRTTPA